VRLVESHGRSEPPTRRPFLWVSLGVAVTGLATTGCNTQPVSACTDPGRIRIAPADTTMILGTGFVASAYRITCGTSSPLDEQVTWHSQDPTIADVDAAAGRVTGKAVGLTHIFATGARSGDLGKVAVFVYNPTNPTNYEARTELRYYIERVWKAPGRRYGVHDDAGHTMDGLKIIANPAAGGFIGVYQTYRAGTFDAHLATSADLLNWQWRVTLASSAAQPTIKAAGNGFVVAVETDGDNHLRFYYYDSWSALLNATPSKTYDAARTLSPCAEGTPNIYSGDASRVEVGFHYWSECNVGRQARGVTDWTSWSATKEIGLDTAITRYGMAGVGDRDGILTFRGHQFGVIEGEGVRGDWTSWRVFLYDYETGTADLLNIQTDGGSISFGNPTIEQVQMAGLPALVITLYLFLDGARSGETGSLVYYLPYP
jgi:Big-like domain-containing protein